MVIRRLGNSDPAITSIGCGAWAIGGSGWESAWCGDSIAAIRKSLGEGKVCWIGLSNFSVGQMKRAQTIEPVTSLQPPYSLRRHIKQDRRLLHSPVIDVKAVRLSVYPPT